LPGLADWDAIKNAGLQQGIDAFRRFGNWYKAWKWSQYCQCKTGPANPGHTYQAPDSDTQVIEWQSNAFNHTLVCQAIGTLPAFTTWVYGRIDTTGLDWSNGGQVIFTDFAPTWSVGANYSDVMNLPGYPWCYDLRIGSTAELGRLISQCLQRPLYFAFFGASTLGDADDKLSRVRLRPVLCAQPGEPTPAPDLPAPDASYPAPTACQGNTTQDLADLLCRVLTSQYDQDVVLKRIQRDLGIDTPTNSTDPAPATPGQETAVPADAIGVVVDVSVPSYVGGTVGDVFEYPRLGFLELGTVDGWLPSYQIRHTPLVVRPMPPGVTRASLSTRADVTATWRWLTPKP
jgi:hypothetical protein